MMSTWSKDATERVLWTFVQAAIAGVGTEALAVAAVGGDVSVLRAAAVAGLAAVLATVKALAAKRIGDPDTASTLRPVERRGHPLPGFTHWPDDGDSGTS